MLYDLIELAVKKGFTKHGSNGWVSAAEFLIKDHEKPATAELLFDHDFAKAVFGEEKIGFNFVDKKEIQKWESHLQKLAITPEEDRIKYAWEHKRND